MVLHPLRNFSKLQTPCFVRNARKLDDWISCTENESLLSVKKNYIIYYLNIKIINSLHSNRIVPNKRPRSIYPSIPFRSRPSETPCSCIVSCGISASHFRRCLRRTPLRLYFAILTRLIWIAGKITVGRTS